MVQTNNLHVLWTNADPITSEKMLLMYVTNAKLQQWWDEITVIIWGAPAAFIAENQLIQEAIKQAIVAGVRFSACQACADELEVSDQLQKIGIEVKYWGSDLTRLIKDDENLITI